jgi:U4/U6.U5 tri-snRNP-associated protein 1
VRNRRELNAKLKGATLGDADGGVDDTKSWVKKGRKKGKELDAKRSKGNESMSNIVQGMYDESTWI